MRGTQPALPDRRVRIDGALEHDLLKVGRKHPQHHEDIGVGRRGRHVEFEGAWAGDLGLVRQRRRQEGDAVAHGVEPQHLLRLGRLRAKRAVCRIEIELRPLGAFERPFAFGPLDEAVDMTHLKPHRRLLVPTVLLAVQEVIEETQLQFASIVGVKVRPMLDAVRFEPFLFGRGADKTFEIAARMQPLPAPIGGGQKRHFDPRPNRRARLLIGVIERMSKNLAAEIASGFWRQLLRRQHFRSADQFAVHTAAFAALARAVLHGLDLHVVPILPRMCRGCRRDVSCRDRSRRRPPRCTSRQDAAAAGSPPATG